MWNSFGWIDSCFSLKNAINKSIVFAEIHTLALLSTFHREGSLFVAPAKRAGFGRHNFTRFLVEVVASERALGSPEAAKRAQRELIDFYLEEGAENNASTPTKAKDYAFYLEKYTEVRE